MLLLRIPEHVPQVFLHGRPRDLLQDLPLAVLEVAREHGIFTPFVGVFPSLSLMRAAIMLIMWRSKLAFGDARHFRSCLFLMGISMG